MYIIQLHIIYIYIIHVHVLLIILSYTHGLYIYNCALLVSDLLDGSLDLSMRDLALMSA